MDDKKTLGNRQKLLHRLLKDKGLFKMELQYLANIQLH